MKRLVPPLFLVLVAAFAWQANFKTQAAEVNNVVMTLSAADTANYINYLNLKLSLSSSVGSDSDTHTSTLTGDMLTNLRMDFASASRAASFTGIKFVEQTPGHISFSNVDFDLSLAFDIFSDTITTSNLKATVRTPSTFGAVSGTTIAMADQRFKFNSGTINWDGSVDGSRDMAAKTLNVVPPSGNDGTLTVTSRTDTWTSSTYNLAMTVPMVFNEEVTSGSSPIDYSVKISGNNVGGVSNKAGTLRSTGSFTCAFSPVAGYWDTATTANLQAGSGTWSTSTARWSVSPDGSSSLLAWNSTGENTDAYFNPSGTSTISVSGTPVAKSMIVNGTGYVFNSSNGSSAITLSSGTISTHANATVNAILAGTAGLTKNGSGTLTLGGSMANTYTGMTTVTAGKLILAKTSGYAVTGGITLANNDAYLIVQSPNQFAPTTVVNFAASAYPHMEVYGNTVTVGGLSGVGLVENTESEAGVGNGIIYINNSADFTFNGYLRDSASGSGTLSVVKNGTGTQTLDGAGTGQYTGSLTVLNGTLDHRTATLPKGAYFIKGGTLDIGGKSQTINSFQITGGLVTGTSGTLTSSTTYDVQGGVVSAILAGTVGLNKTVATTAVLSKNNTYTGITAISAGILQVGAGGATGYVSGPIALSNNAALQWNCTANTSYDKLISGTGTLKNSDSGTTTLTHINTYQGTTQISAGKVVAAGPGTLGTSTVLFSANNATLGVGSAGSHLVGFGGNGAGWTLNGMINDTPTPATVTGDDLMVTESTSGVRKSAFFAQRVGTHDFSANFTYQHSGSSVGTADGVTFTLQNDSRGATALGGGGGGLGYGGGESEKILNSVSLHCSIYDNAGPGLSLNVNGAIGGYESMSPVNPKLDDTPINFALSYVDATDTLTVQATQGESTYTKTYTIDIQSYLGDNAFLGFTGATGGLYAEQHVSNFNYACTGTSATYSNTLQVAAGTSSVTLNANVKVAATAALPVITMGNLTMGDYSALHVAAETGTPADLAYGLSLGSATIAGASTFDVANNGSGVGTLTLAGTLVGVGKNAVKTGAGVLDIAGGIQGSLPLFDVQQGTLEFSANVNRPDLDIQTASSTTFLVTNGTTTLSDVIGFGSTKVCDGATLRAASIVQDTLTIGGTAASASCAAVPEPSAFLLIGMAVLGAFAFFRKKR